MSNPKEKDYVHVSCLIDYLKNSKAKEIINSAESLAISTIMNDQEGSPLPLAIQYTNGVGNMAQALSKHDFRTAILFDSPEAFDFTSELLSEQKSHSKPMLISDFIPIDERSFPMSPDGDGWKVVILDEILNYVGKDADLIALLRSIASTISDGGYLIMRIAKVKNKYSWNKEYNDTVVTEAVEKISLRRFKRSITSHGSIKLRHDDEIFSFDASDLHDCARNASFRPTRELGLDPTVWCCYEKI